MSDISRRIQIFLDGSKAGETLKNLTESAAGFKKQLDELPKSSKNYAKQEAELRKQYDQSRDKLDKYQKKIDTTAKVLDNLSGATYNELIKAQKELRAQLGYTERGTESYKAKAKLLADVEKEVTKAKKEQNSELGKNDTNWRRVKNNITAIAGIATGIVFTFRKITDSAVKLSDTFADVRKTTGLTEDEIRSLDESLMKIDTRTSREALLNLARDAGKLGITGTDNVLQFVNAADKINVALGEDLGEGAIRNIGKMADVFGITKELGIEDAYIKIGSAINELGQSSTANESYLVDFTQRLSGVAAQSGISIQNILGFASAFDQSGQGVEMSATTLQKFIMKLYEEPAKFAKLAKKDVTEFSNLLKTDANQAIISVLTSLNSSGGFAQLVPVFQAMGMDGARAVGVLSTLATNIDAVTTAQSISNQAFAEGTSLLNEFDVKNNNAAARVAKHKKELDKLRTELGERLLPTLFGMQSTLLGLTKFAINNKGIILSLAVAYGVYTIAVSKLIAEKKALIYIKTSWQRIANSGLAIWKLLTTAMHLATGSITKAKVAWQAFNTAFKSSAVGLMMTAIAGLGTAFFSLFNRTNEATKASKEMRIEMEKEQRSCDDLFSALKRAEKGSDEYKKIKDKIITQYGSYLSGLIDEKGELTDIEKAYKRVTAAITENFAKKMSASEKEAIFTESMKESSKYAEKLGETLTKQFPAVGDIYKNEILSMVRNGEGIKKIGDYFHSIGVSTDEFYNKYNGVVLNLIHTEDKLQAEFAKIDKKYASQMSDFGIKSRIETLQNDLKNYENELGAMNISVAIGEANQSDVDKLKTKIIATKNEIQKLQKELDKLNNPKTVAGSPPNTNTPPLGEEDDKTKWSLEKDINFNKNKKEIYEKYSSGIIKTAEEREEWITQFEILAYQDRIDALKKHGTLTEKQQKEVAKHEATIAEKRAKLCEKEIKQQEELDKIIAKRLSPIERENAEYVIRLKSLGLYGEDRKNLTEQQLQALELLEKEHNEKLASIHIKELDKRHKTEEQNIVNRFNAGIIKEKQYRQELIDLDYKYWMEKAKLTGMSQEELVKMEQSFQNILLDAVKSGNVQKAKELVTARMQMLKEFQNKAFQAADGNATDADNIDLNALGQKLGLEQEQIQALAESKVELEKWVAEQTEYYEDVKTKAREEAFEKWLKGAEKVAQGVKSGLDILANANQAYNDNQMADLELQKERELAAAGDNAAAREKIEEDFERKKFELQKSQADRNFAVQAAQIVATGALAVIQAFAQLGPIAGGIAAGVIAATTVLQLSTANKERQRIKAMTFQSSSASGDAGSTATGERVATGDAGFSDGGYTGNGGRYEPAGIVHKGEYVTPSYVLASPRALNHVRALEALRQEYHSSGHIVSHKPGFADGGYTSAPTQGLSVEDKEINIKLLTILEDIRRNGIEAYMYFDEFEKKLKTLQDSRSAGTRED